MEEKFISVKEMAKIAGISKETIYNYISRAVKTANWVVKREGSIMMLTKEQAALILEAIKQPKSSGTLANAQTKVKNVQII